MKYAAAPRGVRLAKFFELNKGEWVAEWEDGTRNGMHTTFAAAWGIALRMSETSYGPYEVAMIMFDARGVPGIVGHSYLLASEGVAYEMVSDDELPARVAEHEGKMTEDL